MGATEAAGKASRPWGAPTMGLHDDLFLRQELPVPARAGPQQRARVVPGAQGRLRSARARPLPGAAGRPAAGPAFRERALPFRTENRRRLAVPHPARHALRQRQDAVPVLAGPAPVPRAPQTGAGTVVLLAYAPGQLLRRRWAVAP